MRRRIAQGAIIMLPMNFDQLRADAFEQLNRNRLVIDESAGAPVTRLDAAQDQRVFPGNAVFRKERKNRMPCRQFEHGRDLPLLRALADQRRVAPRAERQGESVKKNGFSRAGLAGHDRQAIAEFEVQAINENNVADGQGGQHGALTMYTNPSPVSRCARRG